MLTHLAHPTSYSELHFEFEPAWQNNTEFGHQSTQAVVGGGAFFDKALPRAVQGENDLIKPLRSGLSSQKARAKPLRMLVLFLDRDKTHVASGDGFADGGRIRCVVLAAFAAHAVRGSPFHSLGALMFRVFVGGMTCCCRG